MAMSIITKVSPKVTLIHLSDTESNIYLVGNTVVDTGTGFNFVRLMDVFRRMGKDFEDIKAVVNTHCHFDHIGGNGFFPKAEIMIHEKDADALEKADREKTVASYFNGNLKPYKIAKRLKEGDVIEGFRVIHTPGHTPGSICLFEPKEKILISGDTVFCDGVGRTDLPGGSEEHLVQSMEKIKKLGAEKLLPGHGQPVLAKASNTIKTIEEYSDWE